MSRNLNKGKNITERILKNIKASINAHMYVHSSWHLPSQLLFAVWNNVTTVNDNVCYWNPEYPTFWSITSSIWILKSKQKTGATKDFCVRGSWRVHKVRGITIVLKKYLDRSPMQYSLHRSRTGHSTLAMFVHFLTQWRLSHNYILSCHSTMSRKSRSTT